MIYIRTANMKSQSDLWNDHLIKQENLSLISLCGREVYKVENS